MSFYTAEFETAVPGEYHLYIVYDPNGDTSDTSDQSIIRGGPTNRLTPVLNPGDVSVEAGILSSLSIDGLDNTSDSTFEDGMGGYYAENDKDQDGIADTVVDRNYTQFSTSVTYQEMKDAAVAISNSGITYFAGGANSNAVINTVLSMVGIDARTVLPTGRSESDYPGLMDFIDGTGDNVVIAFAYSGDNYEYNDNSGKDYIIVQDGAEIEVRKDDNLAEWNNIVLSGHANLNNLYLNQTGDNLYINDGVQSIVTVEDHFEWISGARDYNARYLFVTTDNIGASDIDIANDAISNTTVLKQIDLRLLTTADFDLSTAVSLDSIITALPGQPDVTGTSSDEVIFGDDADNELEGGQGSDTLFGGEGSDTLSFDQNDPSSTYSFADGGLGVDYFKPIDGSEIVLEVGTIRTESGLVENVEGIFGSVSHSGIIQINNLGWQFDLDGERTMTTDYSTVNQSLEFTFSQTSWTVSETDGDPLTDTYSNFRTFGGGIVDSDWYMTGTSYGDTFTVNQNSGGGGLTLGSGDDNVYIDSNDLVRITYTGGNDIVHDGEDVFLLGFSGDISLQDLSVQQTINSISGSGNSRSINHDLEFFVSGKGSILLENISGSVNVGADGTFGTADDDYSLDVLPLLRLNQSTLSSNGLFDLSVTTAINQNRGTQQDDVYSGTDGNDTFLGLSGNDNLSGGLGGDTLEGQMGQDTLFGDDGNDDLFGGLDDDQLFGGNGADDLYGSEGSDYLSGGDGFDRLYGGSENDTLHGDEGEDTLNGGYGDDTLNGGSGNDTLRGDAGIDIAVFGDVFANYTVTDHTDRITVSDAVGTDGTDNLYDIEQIDFTDGTRENGVFTALANTGNSANNTITGDSSDNVLSGNAGDDTLIGGAGADTLDGGTGIDTADYSATIGTITANLSTGTATGDGADTLSGIENLIGGSGNDVFTGDASTNVLNGNAGQDTLNGGAGNDTLNGGDDNDTLNGNDGDDILNGGAGADYLWGHAGNDTLSGDEGGDVLTGGADDDTLYGGDDNDVMFGDGNSLDESTYTETGSDTLIGNGGNDYMYGGRGNDFLYGDDQADVLYGGSGDDYLEGRGQDDTLYGDGGPSYSYTGNDELNGGVGQDDLYGQNGNDILWAGEGADLLYGGAGSDTFAIYEVTGLNNDMAFAMDFVEGEDAIDISELLSVFNSGPYDITDFVNVAQGANTTIQVDRDGTGTAHGWDNVIRIQGNSTMDTDVNNPRIDGTLIVA